MRTSARSIKLVATLCGLVIASWSAAAAAQCGGTTCITWQSGDWDGTFTPPNEGFSGVGNGGASVDGQNVRPVEHNSLGAQRGNLAVNNLSIKPPPPGDFSAVPPDTRPQGAAIGISLAPTVDTTSDGRNLTVSIDPTVPLCARGPNPTCSFGGNSPVPVATGPTTHPNLNDNRGAVRASDPINPANGELVAQYTDLALPGFGVPFNHVRTYRSRLDYDGPLGFGWDYSYNQRIIPGDPNQCSQGVLYAAGDGTVIRFEVTPSSFLTPPDGVHLLLERTSDGWTLTTPEGITSKFIETDGAGLLSSIRDLNGTGISFTWTKTDPGQQWRLTGATDSANRSIVYQYDSTGHLQSVSTGGLAATYDYDGNDLHHVTRADAAEETYQYRSGFPDNDTGSTVPVTEVPAACAKACSANPGCGSSDPCTTAVATARANCHAACAPCNAACQSQCPGIAQTGCQDPIRTCQMGCEAESCTDAKINQICNDAWDGKNKTGNGPTPHSYCNQCADAARASCGSYCSQLSSCVEIAYGFAISAGVTAGIYSGGTAAFYSAVAAFVASLLVCIHNDGIPFDFDTAERLGENFLAQGAIVSGAVKDTSTCVGTAVAHSVCWFLDLFHSTCHEEVDCDYSNTKQGISLFCEDDCFQCNAHGLHCGDGSCNDGHDCSFDCKDRFFGLKSDGSCPEYAAGGGCPASAHSLCSNQCRGACDQNCVANSTAACEEECGRACAPPGSSPPGVLCDAGCDSIDLTGECRQGCEQSCIAANSGPSGTLRYGGLRELNHNLTKVFDGGGREILSNIYGEDPSVPSFDAVINQVSGGFPLQFMYRDLGAEQRGLVTPPTDPEDIRVFQPVMNVSKICTESCTLNPNGATCTRGNLDTFRNAERAMHVTNAFEDRTYYLDALGEIIAIDDIGDNHAFWLFNYQGGQLVASRGPAFDYQCIRHDPNGNILEVDRFPTPGSTSDDSNGIFTATPRVFRMDYQLSPARLTTVYDPRHPLTPIRSYQWDPKGNLILAVDGDGKPTTFIPTAFGPPDTSTQPDGSVTKFVYDQTAGVLKTLIRDSLGPAPMISSVTPDALGRPSVATTPLGETTTWQWTGSKLTSITRHAVGVADEVTSVSVDNNGRVFSSDDGALSVTKKYDKLGRVQSATAVALDQSAPSRTACTHYGPDGRVIEEVLPRGNRLRYFFDGAGRVVTIFKGYFPSDTGLYDDGTWDDDCVPTSPPDNSVLMWSGIYGRDGSLDSFTDPQGATTRILAKTGFGEPAVILEDNGRLTHRGYDQLGNVIWEAVYACGFGQTCAIQPLYAKPQFGAPNLASMVEFTYDANGLMSRTDAWHFDSQTRLPIGDGHSITQIVRDVSNDLVSVTDDNGNPTTYHSDRLGRPTQIDLPTGDTIRTDYADGGATVFRNWPTPAGVLAERLRLTPWGALSERAMLEGQDPVAERPAYPTQSWTYDLHRRNTGGTEVGGPSVVITNDAFGQPGSVIRDFGGGTSETVTQLFNPNGQLDGFRSRAGADTPDTSVLITRDLLDRVQAVTRLDPAAPVVLQEAFYDYYGGSGLIHRSTDSRGIDTIYDRWAGGEIKSATATVPAPVSPQVSTRTFTYDGIGRITTGRAVSGPALFPTSDETVAFTWDSLGNKLSESSTRLPGTTVTDTFDGAGRRVSSTLAGWGVSRLFDQIGRLKDLSVGTATVHFDYIGLGRSARSDDNGALTTGYSYDTFGRLSGLTASGLLGQIAKWKWSAPLDGLPRMATYTNRAGTTTFSAYQVDVGGRLVAEMTPTFGDPASGFSPTSSASDANNAVDSLINAFPHRHLQLDGRGNWRSRESTDPNSSTMTTVRNTLDQYTLLQASAVHYEGDKLTGIDGFNGATYQYDGFGQLISAVPSSQPFNGATYTYDALGRLSSRSTPSTGVELYLYDGSERVVHTGPNPVPNSSTISIMVDGDQQDEHLVRVQDGRFQHMHQDRTGSVFLVSDGIGAVLEQYAYTAYGERTIENQDGFPILETAINNDLGFQGQRHDPVTGLIEMRNRWLKPDLGRFLTADPLGYVAGSNRYNFVEGSPLRWTDPFGLAPREPAQSSSLGSELFGEVLRAWLPAHTGPYIRQPGLTGNAYLDFIRRQDAATAQQWRNAAGEIQKFEVMQAVGGMPMAASPGRAVLPMLRPAMGLAEEGAETGARVLAPVIEAEAGGLKWTLRDAFGTAIPKGEYLPAGEVFGQLTSYTCTAAACRAVASDFGVQLSEETLARALNTTVNGAFIHGVPEALGNLGVEGGRFAKDLTLPALEEGLQGGRPAIVGVRIPGVGSHALVVDAIKGGMVYIRDSLPGIVGKAYTISVQDFLDVWKGTAVFF